MDLMLSYFRWNPLCGPIPESEVNQIDHNSEVVRWIKHRRNFHSEQIFEDVSTGIANT